MAAAQNFFDVEGWLMKNAPKAHQLGLAGLAELVHNAADADAQRLDIQLEHATKAGWEGKQASAELRGQRARHGACGSR